MRVHRALGVACRARGIREQHDVGRSKRARVRPGAAVVAHEFGQVNGVGDGQPTAPVEDRWQVLQVAGAQGAEVVERARRDHDPHGGALDALDATEFHSSCRLTITRAPQSPRTLRNPRSLSIGLTGTAIPPIFQVASRPMTNCGMFCRYSATRSLRPRPRGQRDRQGVAVRLHRACGHRSVEVVQEWTVPKRASPERHIESASECSGLISAGLPCW